MKIYIYRLIIDDSSTYIGKTDNMDRRLKEHKRIYGSHISMILLEEINLLQERDWIPVEKKWIKIFSLSQYELLNKNEGGGGKPIKYQPIWATDMNNNKIKWYSSPTEAAKELNIDVTNIRNALKKKTNTSGGYYWKYDTEVKWPSISNFNPQNEWNFRI